MSLSCSQWLSIGRPRAVSFVAIGAYLQCIAIATVSLSRKVHLLDAQLY